MCREFEWYQKDIRLTGEFSSDSKICKFHVIITSFEVLIQDIDFFADHLCIQQIIIDEAHRLKNQNARVIKVCLYFLYYIHFVLLQKTGTILMFNKSFINIYKSIYSEISIPPLRTTTHSPNIRNSDNCYASELLSSRVPPSKTTSPSCGLF